MHVQAGDRQAQTFLLEVALHLVQLFHHAAIDQLGVGQVNDQVVPLRQPDVFELPLERNPVAEHGGSGRPNQIRFVTGLFDVQERLEERPDRHAVDEMHGELHRDANHNADQQVGGQHANERADKDQQLLLANMVDVQELTRVSQPEASVNEHRGQSRQRNLMNQPRHQRDKRQQKQSVPQVGEPRACSVVDVGFAADDLGDHRQAADRRRQRVRDTDRQHVPVEVGLSLPRVEQIYGFCAQQRFQAADQCE